MSEVKRIVMITRTKPGHMPPKNREIIVEVPAEEEEAPASPKTPKQVSVTKKPAPPAKSE
jgi:hypothetical protein